MSLTNGFVRNTRDQIKAQLESDFRSKYGNDIDVSANSLFGQEIAILVDLEGTDQDQMQDVVDSGAAATSYDVYLTRNCANIGVYRKPATMTEVYVKCYGTNGTVIPAGTIFETTSTGVQVATKALETIIGTDIDVDCVATVAGPTVFAIGSITKIVTTVSGLDSVNNTTESYLTGSFLESDVDLKIRYEVSKRAMGGGSPDAIRAALLALPRVTEASVWDTDQDPLIPLGSFECVVADGDSQTITDEIYHRKGGSGTYGNITGTAVGSDGVGHIIKHSEPTNLEAFITVSAWIKATTSIPNDLVAQIKTAIFNSAPNAGKFAIGVDVHSSQFVGIIQAVHRSIINVDSIWISATTGLPTDWIAVDVPTRIITLSSGTGFLVGQIVTTTGIGGITITGTVQDFTSPVLTLKLVTAGDFISGGAITSSSGTGVIGSVAGYNGVSSLISAGTKDRVKLVEANMQINLKQVIE
jgi:uncharacterized phage protein gp47/JayE